jgi:AcrR family transcriptional regulator
MTGVMTGATPARTATTGAMGGVPAQSREADPGQRVIEATLRCIARWGVAKTTLDDVAREAACSRATVYRLFPGGKDGLLEAVVRVEVDRFFGAIAETIEGAPDLEELVVAGITEAGRRIADHAALQFLAAYELETLLPFLTFAHKDRVLDRAAAWAEPWLAPWLDAAGARAGEWLARLVLCYTACPAGDVDMTDEASVRRLVQTFVLPGLRQLAVAHLSTRGES